MNIEIVATNDENFNIQVKKFGEQFIASDSERVAIAPTEALAVEGVVEMQEIAATAPRGPKPAPLENSKEGHPFDFFGGTSWAGKRQPH